MLQTITLCVVIQRMLCYILLDIHIAFKFALVSGCITITILSAHVQIQY